MAPKRLIDAVKSAQVCCFCVARVRCVPIFIADCAQFGHEH